MTGFVLADRTVAAASPEHLAAVKAAVAAQNVALRDDRRRFHRLAELGWMERRTTEAIAGVLRQSGYRVTAGRDFLNSVTRPGLPEGEAGETGCAAELDTGRPGPLCCIRVDIDALPIGEAPPPHRPAVEGWGSATPGVMHACGHDGHIAIGLGLARVLPPLLADGRGRLRLLFQPAEEGVRGARAVVEAGWLDEVDLLLGFHVGFGVPSGAVAVGVRGFLATEKLRVRLAGRAAHAGMVPEEGRNALLAACQIALGLHALAQSSASGVRVNVGRIDAGRALNIVPDTALLLVELRAERQAELDRLKARARTMIAGMAASYEVEPTVERIGEASEWANDPALAAWAGELAAASGAFEHQLQNHVFGASEDMTVMAHEVAARGGAAGYFILGADLAAGHHTPEFDFDETVLGRGTLFLAALVVSALAA